MNFKMWKRSLFVILVLFLIIPLTVACSQEETNKQENGQTSEAAGGEEKETITFSHSGWDSIGFHNAVASKIIEEGYGYSTEEIQASEQMALMGLRQGDVDVSMEIWTGNIPDQYNEAIESGDIVELGINYSDNEQGLYVPTYVIEGDQERGIEPMAPDLKTVKDLEKYPELFVDEEDPSKGRIYGAIPGWTANEALQGKLKTYGLDEYYNYFQPGSDAALSSSIVSAYEAGKPWVGYYWEPTWITGKYDMTLLKDEPFDEEKWANGFACKYPSQDLTVAVHKDFTKTAPEVADFLKNYETSSEITSKALAYMQDNETDVKEAAEWFLQEYEDLWTGWVPEEVAETVKQSL